MEVKMGDIPANLVCTGKELRKAASKRKLEYFVESVRHEDIEKYIEKGWEVDRERKTRTRLRKPKPPDVRFEDFVWLAFYDLGFPYMNRDRKCKLKFDVYEKQIDVLAKDEHNIFVVECKSSESVQVINARSVLEEFVGKRQQIYRALEREWGRGCCGRVITVVAINSVDKRPEDEEYVRNRSDAYVLLWSKRELDYIRHLADRVGPPAKYQLYAVVFAHRKQKRLKKECLALRCKIGGKVCYSFLMSAKELLNYAYVHHRELTGIVQASQAYQRMLNPAKLKEIAGFVDSEEGFFPNSIIVNFGEKLEWKRKDSHDEVQVGTVTLPEFYGCAWIIDGQHRLYGVASAEKDIMVPVLAFERIDQKEQANLFVEINEKQKKVPADLLWDLYSDIYRDSLDDRQKLLFQIAETAKMLEASGPLMGCIDIPSFPRDRSPELSLTTVCSTILKHSPWDQLKHQDETKTPENAARIISSYFQVLKTLWPEDWAKRKDGVLLTNNGFGVFMMLFQDIVLHLVYKQKKYLLQASRKNDFEELLKKDFLKPVIEFLKADETMRRDIRRMTGRGPQSDNASYLDVKIQDFVPSYSPSRVGPPRQPSTKEPPAISKIEAEARVAEGYLRAFILEKLKVHYGSDRWWKHGLTGDAKKNADERWRQQLDRKPHLRQEEKVNERKFEFVGLGELVQIVMYGENWEGIFVSIFPNKRDFERRIRDIETLRNPCSHARTVDSQDVADGISGLLWLSQCLGIPELNPYAEVSPSEHPSS
jgi:DGQHR domain-containing protein